MLKTTVTKLKNVYYTITFAQRAFGVGTNGKFYKLMASLMKRADKRTKPDKREEEECERGEVLAKLMLASSETAALFSKGLSKPEALQKSSFLVPLVDTREKSTLKKDNIKQNDSNKPECDLSVVAESMSKSVPHSTIPDAHVNKAAKSCTETCRDEIGFCETKSIEPPNSLQNAIPDIILDKDNVDDYPDDKTTPKVFNELRQENFQNNIAPVKENYIHKSRSPYIQSRFYEGDNNNSQCIKFFASCDKTRKPPSTESNSTFDELAKQCLDSPNNKIDERILKEMKKLGVPQTSPRSESSVIEENIIQMDVLRKPRKPAEKTEVEVETTKFEHPPLNYSDEQRLEFEPSNAGENDVRGFSPKLENKNDKSGFRLQSSTDRPTLTDDKPLLNPFDKRNITFDDDTHDVNDAKICCHTKAKGTVQLENTNEELKSCYVNSQNYSKNTDTPLDIHTFSENKAGKEKRSHEPEKNPSNPLKLSMVSEDNMNNANSTAINKSNSVDFQPEVELNFSKQSETNADKVTVNAHVKQDPVDFKIVDEPRVLSKLSEDKAYATTINSSSLINASGVNFQAEGELAYSDTVILEQSKNIAQKAVNEEPKNLGRIFYDRVPKIPEPLLVFNPPEETSAKLGVHAKKIEFPRATEDHGTDHRVTFVENLKSLQIRCNVLPTKNTSEKSTISLLIEIDAIKQPRGKFPDVTYREESSNDENRSIPNLEKIDHVTRDKITMVLPAKQEKTNEAQADAFPKEKAEIPLSEMLKRVRSRNRLEYCHELAKNLEPQCDNKLATVTGKCGDKPSKCPPPCPPRKKPRCRPPKIPSCPPPACPRPCRPTAPSPCPKPVCPGSSKRKGGNPCCPGSSRRKGGNPCCPGSSRRKGGNPCCPGSSNRKGGGNPCCPGSSSPPRRNPCKFSKHLPTIMMDSIVSLIHQRVTTAETELAQNHFFTVTKDAYQRFLNNICFAELYSSRLFPTLNMCGFDSSLVNNESMNSVLARDYVPWVPIPCWPLPKKEAKKPYPCPKGCPMPLPGKLRPPCEQYPCRGFPKRKNSFSIIDLYACLSNSDGGQ